MVIELLVRDVAVFVGVEGREIFLPELLVVGQRAFLSPIGDEGLFQTILVVEVMTAVGLVILEDPTLRLEKNVERPDVEVGRVLRIFEPPALRALDGHLRGCRVLRRSVVEGIAPVVLPVPESKPKIEGVVRDLRLRKVFAPIEVGQLEIELLGFLRR
jgi:hypothetical protein